MFPFSLSGEFSLRRTTAGDAAYEILKGEIISGRLAPGERLIEQRLCGLLGVSRSPLRRALDLLEADRFVVALPNGGVLVAPISVDEARQLYDLREVLEGLCARGAALRLTSDELNRLGDICTRFRDADRYGDIHRVLELGPQFHAVVYQACGTPWCVEILKGLSGHINRYRMLFPKVAPERGRSAPREHLALYEAFCSRDPERAEQEMRAHIRRGAEVLIGALKSYLV